VIAVRILMVAAMIATWHWSQRLLGSRGLGEGGIGDKLHEWMTPLHRYLQGNENAVRWLLITSSLGIDLLGLAVLHRGIFGPTAAPLVGLATLLALRQVSQYLTALPPPEGMIWRDPGFPSLFVTYHVQNDLFFSGHTALAVFGALTVATWGVPLLSLVALLVGIYEIFTVLALRAHWTMDVYAGFVTALVCFYLPRMVG
jgi:hypothetical protein